MFLENIQNVRILVQDGIVLDYGLPFMIIYITF